MNITIIYFSPTGTTKKVLDGIVEGIAPEVAKFADLRNSQNNLNIDKTSTDLVLIGMPTYVSRIPPEACAELKKLKGDGIPVVLVAVYGNNRFGDILLEMKDIAKSAGFVPIAAAAFIGEHSFSTKDMPIAAGRPDEKDMKKAKSLGESIKTKLTDLKSADFADSDLCLPGDFPYREWHKLPAQPPETDEDICIKCGRCAKECPVNAITVTQTVNTDPDKCIFCCACVKVCPASAREVKDAKILEITERLFNNCKDRKEPEIFFE